MPTKTESSMTLKRMQFWKKKYFGGLQISSTELFKIFKKIVISSTFSHIRWNFGINHESSPLFYPLFSVSIKSSFCPSFIFLNSSNTLFQNLLSARLSLFQESPCSPCFKWQLLMGLWPSFDMIYVELTRTIISCIGAPSYLPYILARSWKKRQW